MVPEFLPPVDIKKLKEISDNLNENQDRVNNNLKLLEEWMSYQKHLPQNYDRKILPSFLRGCKQDLEKAKRKLEMFFIAHNTQLDLYGNINTTFEGDLSIKRFFNAAILPELTPEGLRITIFEVTEPDASFFQVEKLLRYVSMLADLRVQHDIFRVAGDIIIIDTSKVKAQHVTKFLCNMTRKSMELIQTASPLKLKQIHIITKLNMVAKAVGVIKQIFKEKMRNRFHVHESYDKLENYIPLKCLPSDYQGHLKSVQEYSDELYTYVSQTDFFEQLASQKLCGPIPKHSTITLSNEEFGIDGSFRKLNLD